MKHHFNALLLMLIALSSWTMTNAHSTIHPGFHEYTNISSLSDQELTAPPLFRIRICANLVLVTVCIELECDLHWTDVILPGSGQLLGHKGCVPVGAVTGNDGVTKTFQGSEDMIRTIESITKAQTGSIRFLEVLKSPTFPGPDGENYQVVPKNYEIKTGPNGRYLPLEVEQVRS